MGNGASGRRGKISVQTVIAGSKFKASINHGEGTSREGEQAEKSTQDSQNSAKNTYLSVDGTTNQNKASPSKTDKKINKVLKKPADKAVKRKTSTKDKPTSHGNPNPNDPNKKKTGDGLFTKNTEPRLPKSNDSNKKPRSELSQQIDSVLQGAVDQKCPLNTKLIRIFISSTFTDTEHERNALMEKVYPKLRSYCKEIGYEFQVVDMRWGVRDEATDIHETADLCIREIRACQQLSVGPNFITLLAEKYGYCPLPPKIEATEFEQILTAVTDVRTKELFHKWYKKDCNEIPASYVFQPVTLWYPDYFSKEDEARDTSRRDCVDDFQHLKSALVTTVRQVFSDEQVIHRFVRSVCEQEIEEGILKPSLTNTDRCGWFYRQFTGLDLTEQSEDSQVLKYVDTFNKQCDVDTRKLLDSFKEKMTKRLNDRNVVEYKVKWTDKGIDPDSTEHRAYLNAFCTDFENMLQTMIAKSIADHQVSLMDSTLYEEVCQHTLFCQAKIDMFHGRKDTLKKICEYTKGSARSPFVLYGRSGSGKTSIVAMAAKQVQEWTERNTCVILRFLGTTPRSSTIRKLLSSVVNQIKYVYNLDTKVPRGTKSLMTAFSAFLSSATKHKPLVVLLDSLDQLSPNGGARQLSWLPKSLPEHVKIIVSTLPDAEFRCFPKLKAMLKDPKSFIEVPNLPEDDVRQILTKWLKSENRTLQPDQLKAIETASRECPLPLYLKISFDEACRWRSYMSLEQTRLQGTIRDAINSLFERIERQHGELLVRHALGYLTAARSGLTANELEDILSCDEEVLNDVFQYWTPPIRRLPPLLWVRIRADLECYLVDRGAEGARVTYWYHRQFIEAARARYLSDDHQRIKLHSNIATYFMGETRSVHDADSTVPSKGGRIPYSRLFSVSAQPLKLSKHQYNLRKLHELPHHLIVSRQWQQLRNNVLCNYEWLEAKIRARSLRDVLDDFHRAEEVYDDPDIAAVGDILELGKDAILADSNQLASQLVSRIYDRKVEDTTSLMKSVLSPTLKTLLQDAHLPEEPSLLPSRAFLSPPGGQLVRTLVGHKTGVYGLATARNGTYLVTGSQDGSVKVWCISDGSMMMTVEDLGEEIKAIRCCDGDKRIVVSSKRGLTVLDFETGEILRSFQTKFFDSPPLFVLAGTKGTTLVYFTEKRLKSVDVITGISGFDFPDVRPVDESELNTFLTAFENTVLCNSKRDENSLNVIDLRQSKIVRSFVIFDHEDDENFLNLTDVAMRTASDVIVAKKMRVDLYSVKTGEKLKSIRCKLDDWISHLSIVPNSDLLVFPKSRKVAVLNLATDERQEVLEHSNYIARTLAAEDGVVVTSGGDSVVRVWDLSREDIHQQTGKPETLLHFYRLPTDPRHLITVGRLGLNVHVITTWDLSTFLPVRKVSNISSSYLKVITDRRAALRLDNRAVIVDLSTWKITCILKGKLPDFIYAGTPDLCVVNDEPKEILTFASDQKSLIIYIIETGDKTGELVGPRQHFEIRAFIVNEEGTVLAHNDEPLDAIYIWDVINRQLLFDISRAGYTRFVLTDAAFTPDGANFVSSIRRTDEDDCIRHPIVWDVKRNKRVHDLRYPKDTDTKSLAVTENHSAVTSHADNNIVVWDLLRGTARHVIPSMHYGRRVDVLSSGGRYAVSHDDKTLILWDVREGKQVASFTADKLHAVQPLFDGDVIALGYDSPLPLVVLRRQGRNLVPYKCPEEGTRAMSGGDMNITFEGIKEINEEEDENQEIQ